MIFLVVLLHAGLVYESSGIGASFWIVDDPSTNDLTGIVNLIIDIFTMPTIFFISGFLVPISLQKHGVWSFLKSRASRLMVPWAVAVLTLLPLYKVIFLSSRGLPQENWTTYFHWSNGIWGMNWLWFLPVLFLFNMVYLLFSRLNIAIPGLSLNRAIGLALVIGMIYSFSIDMLSLQGWTKTVLVDFQNDRLLIYFMTFLIGALCYKLKVFDSEVKSRKLFYLVNATAWVPTCLYLFLVIHFFMNPGVFIFSGIVDGVLIRFTFLLSLLCLLYVLVNTFRLYLDKQGRVGRELSRNSYDVYIIHVVVIGGIALIMLDTEISSLLKYLILSVSTYTASNLAVYAYRKVIGLIDSMWRIQYKSSLTDQ